MGFLKKLKETAEKSVEKGIELGAKGYDSAKDMAPRSIEKHMPNIHSTESEHFTKESTQPKNNKENTQKDNNLTVDPDALLILKTRLAKGEISKEEFEEMKLMLE